MKKAPVGAFFIYGTGRAAADSFLRNRGSEVRDLSTYLAQKRGPFCLRNVRTVANSVLGNGESEHGERRPIAERSSAIWRRLVEY